MNRSGVVPVHNIASSYSLLLIITALSSSCCVCGGPASSTAGPVPFYGVAQVLEEAERARRQELEYYSMGLEPVVNSLRDMANRARSHRIQEALLGMTLREQKNKMPTSRNGSRVDSYGLWHRYQQGKWTESWSAG